MQPLLVTFLALALAACAATAEQRAVRLDGREIKGNAALERQLETDNTICRGETAKTMAVAPPPIRERAGADVFDGCMAQRGYASVPR